MRISRTIHAAKAVFAELPLQLGQQLVAGRASIAPECRNIRHDLPQQPRYPMRAAARNEAIFVAEILFRATPQPLFAS